MSGPIVSFHANVLGTQELAAKFKQLEEAVQEQYLVTATQSGGQVILNAAQDNILTQGLVRTRNLSRSMHMEVTDQSAQSATVEVGTDLEYAAIHEFGGVIQAKNGKYLAHVGQWRSRQPDQAKRSESTQDGRWDPRIGGSGRERSSNI